MQASSDQDIFDTVGHPQSPTRAEAERGCGNSIRSFRLPFSESMMEEPQGGLNSAYGEMEIALAHYDFLVAVAHTKYTLFVQP